MNVKMDLHKLDKEQIISLVEAGALETEKEDVKIKVSVKRETSLKPQEHTRKKRIGRTKGSTKEMIQGRLNRIRQELLNREPLTTRDIKNIGIEGSIFNLIENHLVSAKWVKVVRNEGKETLLYSTKRTPFTESKRGKRGKDKKPRKSNAFLEYKNTRIRGLMREGYSMPDATKKIAKEWNEKKQKNLSDKLPELPTPTELPKLQPFPNFENVNRMYEPILKSILKRCIENEKYIDYNGVSYALDLKTEADYRNFVDDVLTNSKAIKRYFGAKDGSFRYDGSKLSFN